MRDVGLVAVEMRAGGHDQPVALGRQARLGEAGVPVEGNIDRIGQARAPRQVEEGQRRQPLGEIRIAAEIDEHEGEAAIRRAKGDDRHAGERKALRCRAAIVGRGVAKLDQPGAGIAALRHGQVGDDLTHEIGIGNAGRGFGVQRYGLLRLRPGRLRSAGHHREK